MRHLRDTNLRYKQAWEMFDNISIFYQEKIKVVNKTSWFSLQERKVLQLHKLEYLLPKKVTKQFWKSCECFLRILLIWRCHHDLWRAANFELCSALMAIKLWGFLSVPHLQWHGASVYNGYLGGPATLTPIVERLAVELSIPVFMTYICCGWDLSTQPMLVGRTLKPTAPLLQRDMIQVVHITPHNIFYISYLNC